VTLHFLFPEFLINYLVGIDGSPGPKGTVGAKGEHFIWMPILAAVA